MQPRQCLLAGPAALLQPDLAELFADLTQLLAHLTVVLANVAVLQPDIAKLLADVSQLLADVAVIQPDFSELNTAWKGSWKEHQELQDWCRLALRKIQSHTQACTRLDFLSVG